MIPGNIIEAMTWPEWWGQWFKRGDWSAWHAFLAALFALPIDEDAAAIFRECTGRTAVPSQRAREAWAICGRRGGKTRIMALIAAWLACFLDWRQYLAPGERATIMLIAADRRQARVAMRYLRSLIVDHPTLAKLVVKDQDELIELSNGVTIEVTTASFRTTRGYTVAAVIADELSFWFDSEMSANPASEILVAVRAAMATMPDALLMVATTPYARRGVVYETWRRHWAKDDDPILVWRAPTRRMNPAVPQSIIDEAMEADPSAASAEYLAEFRSDIEDAFSREAVDAATVAGRHELLPLTGTIYCAFVDPSGGSADSMTLAVAHRDRDGRSVLDAVRERRPPFSPESVVTEFVDLLRSYGVTRISGDRYAGEWPREKFRQGGIQYDTADKPKSDIYRELLPLLNSGKLELLDNSRLAAQLCGLERRTSRAGKDSIDHAPGAHDDVANAAAGALVLTAAETHRSLWRIAALLANGAPVPVPSSSNGVLAVLIVDKRGSAAIVYFARNVFRGYPLVILDCELVTLSANLFDELAGRLVGFASECAAPAALLFTTRPLAEEAHRRGYRAHAVDTIVAEGEDLAMSAAAHIASDRVKITGAVLDKTLQLPLGGVTDGLAGADDPLRAAALVGIALALDENRELTGRAA